MDSYCSPYSEGELFPILLMPFGVTIIILIIFIAKKLDYTRIISEFFEEVNPFKIYVTGIPIVFILAFNAVYSSPGSISATGSETITDPFFRALYVTGLFSILWPLLLLTGIAIDGLLIGTLIYYPLKDFICGNFLNFTNINLFDPIFFFFSPFNLFFNGPLIYIIFFVIILRFKHSYDFKTELREFQ